MLIQIQTRLWKWISPLCFSSCLRAAQELLSSVIVALEVPMSSPRTGPLLPCPHSALGRGTLVLACHQVRSGHWSSWLTPELGFLVQMLQKVLVHKVTPKMSVPLVSILSCAVVSRSQGRCHHPGHSHIAGATSGGFISVGWDEASVSCLLLGSECL